MYPVIGEKIVDAVEGKLDPELKELWKWKEEGPPGFDGVDDGARGGPRGMVLEKEQLRERKSRR